ncbi:MAG: hypothetical protein GY756_02600, partial [bacterium]|nr:hypothetical protein [bacterium]
NNDMISKKTFIKVIELIEAQDKLENEVTKDLQKFTNGHSIATLAINLREAIELLIDEDTYEWIEWYLYDVKEDSRIVKLNSESEWENVGSPKKLYDFIIRLNKQNA